MAQSFDCVTAAGFIRREKEQCRTDVYDYVYLAQPSALSSTECCSACARLDRCKACSFTDSVCTLVRDAQLSDATPLNMISSTSRLIYRTVSGGCECKPTYLTALQSFATCYAVGTSVYGCTIDSSRPCRNGSLPVQEEWASCNGTLNEMQ